MYIVHVTFFLKKKKENIFIVDSNALSIHLLFLFVLITQLQNTIS